MPRPRTVAGGVGGGIGSAFKGVGKRIKHGAKVGRAAVKLTARMVNPVNSTKMVANAIKGKGIVLPGSNYIGPGNAMDNPVLTKTDALAKKHDQDYDRYLKAGYSEKKIYAGFSDADKRLMKASDTTTASGLATYSGMKAKHVLNKLGLTGKRTTDANLRKREKEQAAGTRPIPKAYQTTKTPSIASFAPPMSRKKKG